MHVCVCVCVCLRLCVCAYAYMCLCACACSYALSHTHTHTHTHLDMHTLMCKHRHRDEKLAKPVTVCLFIKVQWQCLLTAPQTRLRGVFPLLSYPQYRKVDGQEPTHQWSPNQERNHCPEVRQYKNCCFFTAVIHRNHSASITSEPRDLLWACRQNTVLINILSAKRFLLSVTMDTSAKHPTVCFQSFIGAF